MAPHPSALPNEHAPKSLRCSSELSLTPRAPVLLADTCQSRQILQRLCCWPPTQAWQTLTAIPPYRHRQDGGLERNPEFVASFGEWPASPMQTIVRGCLRGDPKQRPTMQVSPGSPALCCPAMFCAAL